MVLFGRNGAVPSLRQEAEWAKAGMAEMAGTRGEREAAACIDEQGMLALEAKQASRSRRAEGWPSG